MVDSKPSQEALKLRRMRYLKKKDDDRFKHTKEKAEQIENLLKDKSDQKILELMCGHKNLTKIYEKYGIVEAHDKIVDKGKGADKICSELYLDKKKFDVIDLDPYGVPVDSYLPMITKLFKPKKKNLLFLTICKPNEMQRSLRFRKKMMVWFGCSNPSLQIIKETIAREFLRYGWFEIKFLDDRELDLGSVWRVVGTVEKVKVDTLEV